MNRAVSRLTRSVGRILGISDRTPEEIFGRAYRTNEWCGTESVSGTGSDLQQTAKLRAALPDLIDAHDIKSMLDAPCGDFHWMSSVDLSGIRYIGADIVDDLVKTNSNRYSAENISFTRLNLISDRLPRSDLIFCRDCLVHLSYADIFSALENMKQSGSTYLLTTTFTDRASNIDKRTGGWRALNLYKAPFDFPPPLLIINEGCTENDGLYADKSMGLWRLQDLTLR